MQFWVLESPAQFSTHCIVIGSTVRLRILGFGIVIERTVCEKCCCYLQHSLPGQAAGFLQNLLLSSAQFGKIHGLFRVVIGGTFPLPGQNQSCYVRHISKNSACFSHVVICSTFSGWGLLFSAQFTVCIISFLQRRVLLFTAHFAKNHCLAYLPCCYSRHNSRKNFCWSCYSAHNSAKILLLPGRLLVSTQFQEFSPGVVIHGTILFFAKFPIFLPLLLFAAQFPQKSFLDFWVLESSAQFEWFPEFQKSRLWGCYSAHSSQNPPNRHRTILAQKIIFSGCYARHIVALRTKQLLFTAHRSWNPRHISVVIFDTATHYF